MPSERDFLMSCLIDFSGEPLSDASMLLQHYTCVGQVQRAAFEHFKDDLFDFSLSNVAAIDTREGLLKHMSKLSDEKFLNFLVTLNLFRANEPAPSRAFMAEVLMMYISFESHLFTVI